MRKINFKLIIAFAIVFLTGIISSPYFKAEYLTSKYGEQFRNEYKQTNMINSVSYHKVIEYSAHEAEVFYVASGCAGYKIWFTYDYEEREWVMTTWDCIWSTSGSADNFCWPYYR